MSINLTNNLLGSMIMYYCIQPIGDEPDIVNQANPFMPDLSYRSESYLRRAYQCILKTKQLRAKELKDGPCKQAARLYWRYVLKAKLFHTKGRQNYGGFC